MIRFDLRFFFRWDQPPVDMFKKFLEIALCIPTGVENVHSFGTFSIFNWVAL